MDKTRLFAVLILKEVLDGSRWSNKLLPEFRNRLPRAERGRLTELVMGTIKMKLRLDWTIERYLRGYKLSDLTAPMRNVLRLATYELLFLERVPEYASVKEGVNLARRFGHSGVASLANAVLRKIAAVKPAPKEPWILLSHPEWLYRKWASAYGREKALSIMEDNNGPSSFYIRINTRRIAPEDFKAKLSSLGITYEETQFEETLRIFFFGEELGELRGLFTVQDLSSQAVSRFLAPEKKGVIYDLAAAPGGKTTHIAEIIDDEGAIIALDRYRSRIKILMRRSIELGHSSIFPVVGDLLELPLKASADFVLLDAPCSGTGTLKRHPEIRWRLKPEDIGKLARYQLRLLEKASLLVKDGGILVYSTCTLEPEENEGVVEDFLRKNPGFELAVAERSELGDFLDGPYLRVNGVVNKSDWTFAARLRRKSS